MLLAAQVIRVSLGRRTLRRLFWRDVMRSTAVGRHLWLWLTVAEVGVGRHHVCRIGHGRQRAYSRSQVPSPLYRRWLLPKLLPRSRLRRHVTPKSLAHELVHRCIQRRGVPPRAAGRECGGYERNSGRILTHMPSAKPRVRDSFEIFRQRSHY